MSIVVGVLLFLVPARLMASWSGQVPVWLVLLLVPGVTLYSMGILVLFRFPKYELQHPTYGMTSALCFALFAALALGLVNYGIGGTLGPAGSMAVVLCSALCIAAAARAAWVARHQREAKIKEAREALRLADQSPAALLQALRIAIGLSDIELGKVVDRTAGSVRRWRRDPGSAVDLPEPGANAIERLRSIVARLVEADCDGTMIREFIQSRNLGLGFDRPLDAVRVEDQDAFRRVDHVTECFVLAIAPEPGKRVLAARNGRNRRRLA